MVAIVDNYPAPTRHPCAADLERSVNETLQKGRHYFKIDPTCTKRDHDMFRRGVRDVLELLEMLYGELPEEADDMDAIDDMEEPEAEAPTVGEPTLVPDHEPDEGPPKVEVDSEQCLNCRGLPLRPGVPACGFYMRKGTCRYGQTCKWDHPEVEAVVRSQMKAKVGPVVESVTEGDKNDQGQDDEDDCDDSSDEYQDTVSPMPVGPWSHAPATHLHRPPPGLTRHGLQAPSQGRQEGHLPEFAQPLGFTGHIDSATMGVPPAHGLNPYMVPWPMVPPLGFPAGAPAAPVPGFAPGYPLCPLGWFGTNPYNLGLAADQMVAASVPHAGQPLPAPGDVAGRRLRQRGPRSAGKQDEAQLIEFERSIGIIRDCPSDGPPPGGTPRRKTTMMLRNIPNKYTQETLLEEMDRRGFKSACDFFYLPMDFRFRCNMGYAFINFTSAETADAFLKAFSGLKLGAALHGSKKTCEVCPARIQGWSANVAAYRNSSVMSVPIQAYKPIVLAAGEVRPFPGPQVAIPPVVLREPRK